MLIVPPKPFLRRRRNAAASASPPPPPPAGDRIWAVSVDPDNSNRLIVALGAALTDVQLPQGFRALQDGEWIDADNVEIVGDSISFIFLDSIDQATQWEVPDSSVWTWADHGVMVEPFAGDVE